MQDYNLFDFSVKEKQRKKRKIILLLLLPLIIISLIVYLLALLFNGADRLMQLPGQSFNYVAENILPKHETLVFKAYKSDLKLQGWYFPAKGHVRGNILIVPGQRANRLLYDLSTVNLYKFFQDEGFNCFAYDPRHTGLSEGSLGTYGFNEQYDVLGALKAFKKRSGRSDFIIYANGSGVAAALYAWNDLPEYKDLEIGQRDLVAAILDTAASSTDDYIRADLKQSGWWNRNFYNVYLPWALKLSVGAKDDVHLLPLACQIQAPMLLLRNQPDPFIAQNSLDNLAAERLRLNPETTTVVKFPTPGHQNAYLLDSQAYLKELEIFLNKWCAYND